MSNQGNVIARAASLQQAGDLEQAASVYEQILRSDPLHADAWHQLGLVVHRLGRPEQAAACLSRAASLDGSNAVVQCDLGVVSHQLGRLDEAIDCFQQAVQLAPELTPAHYNLGLILQQRGDRVGARLRFQQVVRLRPEFAEAWNHLGIVHQSAGELDEATHCFERLATLVPDMAEGHFNLGNTRLAQNRLIEAVTCYTRALERQPRFPEALNNLGTALHRMGRFEPARRAYRAAIELSPEFADARNNLGALASLMGRHTEAESCYREALRLDPQSSAARNNLAGVLQAQLQLEEAEQFLREALAINPQAAHAPGNLANVLAQQGKLSEAGEWYRQALASKADVRLLIQASLILPPIYESTGEIQRCRVAFADRLAQLEARQVALDPEREPVAVNFLLAYQGQNDRHLARRVAGLYRPARDVLVIPSPSPALPPAPHFPPQSASMARHVTNSALAVGGLNRAQAPIRIGFLSKFLRDHTIGDLTKGLIHELSRSEFSATVFLVGDAEDATVSLLRQTADAFVNLPEDIGTARRIVAEANLDVLVYPDVGMEPISTTLALSRLARVQSAMWGHPVTTGIPTIDYFISSQLVEPADAAGHYSENLVLLDSLPTYYYRPRITSGNKGADCPPGVTAPARLAARQEFGFDESDHLYLCPQSLFKFHPDFDSLLSAILSRDPTARLILIEAPHRHWTETLSRRLANNLNGQFDRVRFVPRVDRAGFLRLLTTADVILDPLHFGGGNTSFQALGLGVPVVTLPSAYMRGRVTAGCYRKMGYRTYIARNSDDYVNLAVRLGMDPEFNARVRAEIDSRNSALFEDRGAVRELEEFFKSAVRSSPQRAAGFIPTVSGTGAG